MIDVILDSLFDSLKIFGVAFVVYVIISFIEDKRKLGIMKNRKRSKIFASLLGVVPQCGFGMVASDMYLKQQITMGTLIAVFIATSDEALIVMLSDPSKQLILIMLLLIAIKIVYGTLIGIFTDLIFKNPTIGEETTEESPSCHDKEGLKEKSKIYLHLWHPLIHAAEIFLYAIIINIVLNSIIYFTGGEEAFAAILSKAKNFGPLIACLVGAIPNCASSVALTKVFMLGGLSFGSLVSGLCMNAGLGMLFLFKNRKNFKNNLLILFIMTISSITLGYLIHFIMMLI